MTAAEVAIVVAAVAIGFFVKGVTGLGGPLLATPVLASFVGVETAVVVIAIPALITNAWLLVEHRANFGASRSQLLPLAISGAVGAAVGTWLLVRLDDRILSVSLALVIVLYIVRSFTHPDFRLSDRAARLLAPPVGFASGGLQGATGVSAPLLTTFVHSRRPERGVFLFTMTGLFLMYGIVQIVSLTLLGEYTAERIGAGLLSMVPILIVFPIGIRWSRRLSTKAFDLVVLAILAFSAVRLVTSAL